MAQGKRRSFGLAVQIAVGLVLGIAVGAAFHQNPTAIAILKPIGDLFLRLIKMIVVPIVVSTLVVGIAGSGNLKSVGRLGFKTLLYFEIITTIAIVVGLLAANLVKPGEGINLAQLAKADIHQYVDTAETARHSMVDTFLNIVPTNIVEALANGNMLAIVFFSVFFGLGVAAVGEKGQPVLRFFEGVSAAMFWVTNRVMALAPIGVFALIGVTVAKFGAAALIPLGKLVLTVYVTMALFVLVVFGAVARWCGIGLFRLLSLLKDELLLAFSTASSETVLPRLIDKMERFGCPRGITSFVIPTGYTFNLDGSTLYQALATLFIAQLFGVDMPLSKQILVVLVLMVTSKGIAGVSGASLVVLLATLGSVGLPVEGVAFIAAIDRVLDMARTAVNVIGNALAAVVLAKWEGQFRPPAAHPVAPEPARPVSS